MESSSSRRKSPGAVPLSEAREQYRRLIARGVSNAEACRQVGVNRRTGTRWRYGRVVAARDGRELHYPGMDTVAMERSGRYLSEEERVVIADRLRAKVSLRAIARELGRAASTISREVARNRHPQGGYRPSAAQRMATARLPRPRARKVQNPVLRTLVQESLDAKWSPEQISHSLALRFPHDPTRQVATESIYQALYAKDSALQRKPAACLRTGRRRRRPHRRPDRRRPHDPGQMTPIADRPAEAEDRSVPGHWEGDLVTGAANRSAIITLVERSSGYVLLGHLSGSHTAEVTRDRLIATYAPLPATLRRSLTWDRGTEMADHLQVTEATGLPIFFCDPRSPWQRGSNENTNGLLRQYFPKGTDLSVHCADRLAQVQDELNNRPRKRLGWASPATHLTALHSSKE